MIEIPLSRGLVALVDDIDAELLGGRSWWAVKRRNTFYASGAVQGRTVYMHRYILGVSDPRVFVDHENGEGLDNRRANLRRATNSANRANCGPLGGRSLFKGVFPAGARWRAQLTVDGVRRSLGTFATEAEAAEAYNRAAHEAHGRFARHSACNRVTRLIRLPP
jgi:hypothetical protein